MPPLKPVPRDLLPEDISAGKRILMSALAGEDVQAVPPSLQGLAQV